LILVLLVFVNVFQTAVLFQRSIAERFETLFSVDKWKTLSARFS